MLTWQASGYQCTLWRVSSNQGLHANPIKLHTVVGLRHGQQHVNPLLAAGWSARDVQSVRNQGVLQGQHGFAESHDRIFQRAARYRLTPHGFYGHEVQRNRLLLNNRRHVGALILLWRHTTPTLQ